MRLNIKKINMSNSFGNRNKQIFLFSLSILILLLVSCEEILNIQVPVHAPMLTVNSILNAGKEIQLQLTSSQPYPPLTDSTLTIKDAEVKLFEDDVYIEDLVYQETYRFRNDFGYLYLAKNYFSLNHFSPGLNHTYSIRVVAPGFTDVISKTFIPKPVSVVSVDTSTVFIPHGANKLKTIECIIKFKDPPGERNCYEFSITRRGLLDEPPGISGGFSGTSNIQYTIPFYCNDLNAVYFRKTPYSLGSFIPVTEEEEITPNRIFIADDSFDGMTYELKVMIPIWVLFDNASAPIPGVKFALRKINFELSSINEEYYKYARSNYLQTYKKNDIFSESCYVYSNINNGVGIFSGSSVSIDSSIVMEIRYNPGMYY